MVTLLALGAALFYALGAALQHAAAAEQRDVGMRFVLALFLHSTWLMGYALNACGFGLQVAALSRGQLVYVQPILLLSVVLSLPITAIVRGDRPGAREWSGSCLLLIGVIAFLLGTRPRGDGHAVALDAWLWSGFSIGVASMSCIWLGKRHSRHAATLYAVASGILFGLAAALAKATVDSGRAFLESWPLYALMCATPLAFYWMQRAYHAGPLAASFPVIIALDPLVSGLLGLFLYHERIALDTASLAIACSGVLAILGGIWLLSRSRFVDYISNSVASHSIPSSVGGAM